MNDAPSLEWIWGSSDPNSSQVGYLPPKLGNGGGEFLRDENLEKTATQGGVVDSS